MQIVIDGVQMPNNCHECDSLGFSDIIGLRCPAYDFDKGPKLCPLTPLPEHHGDLIDRNELHYHCNYNNGLGCDKICHCDGCVHNVIQERTVNAVSTIIPATEEGE